MIDPVIIHSEQVSSKTPKATLYYGGNVLNTLKQLPDKSVHMVCTSPPYWSLRDYGTEKQEWPEMSFVPMYGLDSIQINHQKESLGLESNINDYVGHLVLICREVNRVLRDDGIFWLNLGDSYSDTPNKSIPPRKNLISVPWRVALALQADGWILRSDVIWSKVNAMPEPIKDRPIRSHEYVFMFSKSPVYYYDTEAIRENVSESSQDAPQSTLTAPNGRYRRDVWFIASASYKGAHFATWPPRLVELMIKAGTSEKGVCPHCGNPWVRQVKLVGGETTGRRKKHNTALIAGKQGVLNTSRVMVKKQKIIAKHVTTGWKPTCDCANNEPIAATVMDIFSGSGTTGQMALSRGRDYIGLDLNVSYLDLAKNRILEHQVPTKETSNQSFKEPKDRKWDVDVSCNLLGFFDEN